MIPALCRLGFRSRREWVLYPFLLGLLPALRPFPAVVRRLLPFSAPPQEIWAQRRSLSKACDSYQSQKMLYIGIGLAVYVVVSGEFQAFRLAVCSSCLVSGALGLMRWRVVAEQNKGEQ